MAEAHPNSRLEAFCDGVFAIALTLLIIDVRLPATERITSTAAFWRALAHIAPSVLAFLLSFTVIFIAWVNHHAAMRLINKSSPPFVYANGFLLLTVVFVPFPTALMGEYLFTDHAAPAVVLYDAVLAFQALGWILAGQAVLRGQLTKTAQATLLAQVNLRYAYFGVTLYSLFAVAAVWWPLAIAIVTIVTWIFWLILGVRMKHE